MKFMILGFSLIVIGLLSLFLAKHK
jgi:hypothetical protein